MSAGSAMGGGGPNSVTVAVKWIKVVTTSPPSGATPVKRVIFQGFDSTSGAIRRGYFNLTAANLRDLNKLAGSVVAGTVSYDEGAAKIGYSYTDEFVVDGEQWSTVITQPMPPDHYEATNFV